MKCIRIENGGEYIGLFDNHYKEYDILYEQTIPKTPQHNEVVEMVNHASIEKVRYISHGQCFQDHSGFKHYKQPIISSIYRPPIL